jgi:hypothetical protein
LTVVLLASMLGMATDARAMQRAIEIGGDGSRRRRRNWTPSAID